MGSACLAAAANAADPLTDLARSQMPAVVQDEYAKMERQLQAELNAAQSRLKTLQAEKDAASVRAADQAKIDETGIRLFKDFDTLLHAKYVDKKGKWSPGLELAQSDVDNVNGIFLAHLAMTPFSGRVSAGQAHRQVAWATERLDDIMKAHREPTESNNSEFEIIAKQTHDEELRIEKANALAEILGLKLDASGGATAAVSSDSAATKAMLQNLPPPPANAAPSNPTPTAAATSTTSATAATAATATPPSVNTNITPSQPVAITASTPVKKTVRAPASKAKTAKKKKIEKNKKKARKKVVEEDSEEDEDQ